MAAKEVAKDITYLSDSYSCFEENLNSITTLIKNQQELKTQFAEKSKECERLRCSLDNDRAKMKELHSLYENFTQNYDLLMNKNDPIHSQSERGNSIQRYEMSSRDTMAKELLDRDGQQIKILNLELKETEKKCTRLEVRLQTANEELKENEKKLHDEKALRSKVEAERDSLYCLAEKLQLILLKYEKALSSYTLKNEKPTTEFDMMVENTSDSTDFVLKISPSSSSDMSDTGGESPSRMENKTKYRSIAENTEERTCTKLGFNPRRSRKKRSPKPRANAIIDNSSSADEHEKDPSVQCDICNRFYASKSSLYLHKRYVHSGVKPFQCSECTNKTFARKFELKQHILKWHT